MPRAALIVTLVFLAIYLPGVGHGFISDDFRWIVESRASSVADLVALFGKNVGFHRPVVSLSFAADYAMWGTSAFGYGLTNLVVCLASAAMLWLTARRIGLPAAPALVAASVWLFNFHAVNMAVLWLSGRTALLASLLSLAAVHAAFGGGAWLAGLFALLAMLAKEEAVALPVFVTAAYFVMGQRAGSGVATAQSVATRAIPVWIALLVYLALRVQSGAFWPSNAPSYYQFSFAPSVVAGNLLQYADRAGTVFVGVAIVFVVAARLRWADATAVDRKALAIAALWVPAMFALTLFLPVRSSLYALLPSIGSALAVGVVAAAAQRRAPATFRRAIVGLLVVSALLVPVYWSRNVRWVRLAELSEASMRTIVDAAKDHASGHVVLIDDGDARFNLVSAFGNLLPEALRLRIGDGWTGEIVAAPEEATLPADLAYRLSEGTLVPILAARRALARRERAGGCETRTGPLPDCS
jgi:xanthosine utilization system XapX-like protein